VKRQRSESPLLRLRHPLPKGRSEPLAFPRKQNRRPQQWVARFADPPPLRRSPCLHIKHRTLGFITCANSARERHLSAARGVGSGGARAASIGSWCFVRQIPRLRSCQEEVGCPVHPSLRCLRTGSASGRTLRGLRSAQDDERRWLDRSSGGGLKAGPGVAASGVQARAFVRRPEGVGWQSSCCRGTPLQSRPPPTSQSPPHRAIGKEADCNYGRRGRVYAEVGVFYV